MTQTWSIDMLLAELQGFKHGREHATASSGATQRSKATSVHCTWRAASPSPSPPPPSPGRGTQQRTATQQTLDLHVRLPLPYIEMQILALRPCNSHVPCICMFPPCKPPRHRLGKWPEGVRPATWHVPASWTTLAAQPVLSSRPTLPPMTATSHCSLPPESDSLPSEKPY